MLRRHCYYVIQLNNRFQTMKENKTLKFLEILIFRKKVQYRIVYFGGGKDI